MIAFKKSSVLAITAAWLASSAGTLALAPTRNDLDNEDVTVRDVLEIVVDESEIIADPIPHPAYPDRWNRQQEPPVFTWNWVFLRWLVLRWR